ncbi:MAG TPA: hypothetical protein VER12_10475 [Polyangiaceae bacterium]|nr:hypothetical protein [Polyangiaceae bacterium]
MLEPPPQPVSIEPPATPLLPIATPETAPLFDGKAVRAEHSAPVVGGTLLVTLDGRTIVASDPDRDAVFLIDAASRVVSKVSLSRGEEPGRIAEGPDGTLFVALRRAGALLKIDLRSASILQRATVCASPRGVAYDRKNASVYVACRSGQLRTLDADTLVPKRTLQLDTDLRDVLVREHDLVVTRFLSAEVLVVAEDGSVSRRGRPPSSCGDATVAYRALSLPDGQVALAHQISSNDAAGEGPSGYGGGTPCGIGLVTRSLTLVDTQRPSPTEPSSDLGAAGAANEISPGALDPGGESPRLPMTFHTSFLPGAGPLDVAFDAQGTRMAVIAMDSQLAAIPEVAGALERPTVDPGATLWLSPRGTSEQGFFDAARVSSVKLTGQPVAVAFSAAGEYIVQSREPAALWFEDGTSVTLSDESRADSGHLMFHMNSGVGIACASCHPEGGDDGHVWRFPEGLRRTMPLEGGVLERAPFHWDGTLGDMQELVQTVMVTRMGLRRLPSAPQIAALGSFLEQLPSLPPPDALDPAAVSRGAAIFKREDVACATCHSGPQFTNNQLADVGTGGSFVTPTLLGVGLRPALFHDGCAKGIGQRFGVCGGTAHGKPELLSADERADLIAFLRSL